MRGLWVVGWWCWEWGNGRWRCSSRLVCLNFSCRGPHRAICTTMDIVFQFLRGNVNAALWCGCMGCWALCRKGTLFREILGLERSGFPVSCFFVHSDCDPDGSMWKWDNKINMMVGWWRSVGWYERRESRRQESAKAEEREIWPNELLSGCRWNQFAGRGWWIGTSCKYFETIARIQVLWMRRWLDSLIPLRFLQHAKIFFSSNPQSD